MGVSCEKINVLDGVFLAGMTLLFFVDFFPTTPAAAAVPEGPPVILIITAIVVSLMVKKYLVTDPKETFRWMLFLNGYLVVLIPVFRQIVFRARLVQRYSCAKPDEMKPDNGSRNMPLPFSAEACLQENYLRMS